MRLETLKIPARDQDLAALRYLPDSVPKTPRLLYAHGFTSAKHSLDPLASYLAGRGYEGVSFDFVGHKLGATGGELRHIQQIVENLSDALAWFHAEAPHRPIVLVGHSMGAAASLAVAAERTDNAPLSGVIALCMGVQPMLGFQSVIGKAMQTQRADYVQGAPSAQLMEEIEALLPLKQQAGDLPALFVAARQDVLFTPERVEALANAAATKAEFVLIEAAHLDAPDKAKATLLAWLDRQNFAK